jgi:GDPmannose 4,6-dehydratase
MKLETAMIVGSEGQDGTLMCQLLSREGVPCEEVNRKTCDIREFSQVLAIISKCEPCYLFYFAAHHTAATDVQIKAENKTYFDVNTIGVINFLDAIKISSPRTHFFYTSSSLIFAPSTSGLLNEKSDLDLRDFYTISKHASMKLCDLYREKFGIKTTVGIMFNHESRFRKSKFVSKKIVDFVVDVARGSREKLILGDLSTVVDWGAAEDYMEAAYLLLKKEKVGDYIFSSGEGHTLREFCEVAFSYVGLDYTKFVSTQKKEIARTNHTRVGDNEKLRLAINWKPRTSFQEMIRKMVDAALMENK